jgi:hypothetical protein
MRLSRAPGAVGETDRSETLGRRRLGVVLGGALERIGELFPCVDHEVGEQVITAGDVPVERRTGHPELLGDGIQGKALHAELRELAQGRGLDLLTGPRA